MIEGTVALGIIGLAATCIACLVWVVKLVLSKISPSLDKMSRLIEQDIKVTRETHQLIERLIHDPTSNIYKAINGKQDNDR